MLLIFKKKQEDMLFKLTHPLPKKFRVAVSGGVDSMAALNWLNQKSRQSSIIEVLHVNHGTEHAHMYDSFVKHKCEELGLKSTTYHLKDPPQKGESKEKHWRDARYHFFHSYEEPVILCHNMDDCLEEYIMNTMVRGRQGTIPYANKNCIRPFRLWRKKSIIDYANRKGLDWVEDPTNSDTSYKRNYIRHKIVHNVLAINPGIWKIVEREIKKTDKRLENAQT